MDSGLPPAALWLLLLTNLLPQTLGQGPPRFITTPSDQTGVSGGAASFVCRARGEPKPQITWMKNGKKISSQRFQIMELDGGSGSVLRIQPLRSHRDEAFYQCLATNPVGESNASARLSVVEEDFLPGGFPSITMPPQLKVVERTRTATLLCAAAGEPDPDILWLKDQLPVEVDVEGEGGGGRVRQLRSGGTPIRGALQIENSDESDQGKYECVAVNSVGIRFSAPANLYVRDQREVRRVPPRFSIPPVDRAVMPGGAVNLTCVAVGAPMPRVRWTGGEGVELMDKVNAPIGRNVLELVDIRTSNNYTCIAESALGIVQTTAQVTVKALPRPPDSLYITETTATSVTITWSSGNLDPVSYYVVQYRNRLLANGFQEVDGVATTRYSVGGLSPFSDYEFRVAAVNDVGRGPASVAVATRTVPDQPAGLEAEAELDSRVLLSWFWPGPDLVTGYELVYWEARDPTDKHHVALEAAGSFAVEGLKSDTTYFFMLAARSESGLGIFTLPVQARTPHAMGGAPPRSVRAHTVNSSAIRATWKRPLTPLQFEQIQGYRLICTRLEDGDPHGRPVVVDLSSPDAQEFVIGGLVAGSSYSVTVAALTNQGHRTPSKPTRVQTSGPVPGKPWMTISTTVGNTALVQWQPPLETFGELTGYQLQFKRFDDESFATRDFVQTDDHVTITGLHKGAHYTFKLSARNGAGSSEECIKEIDTPEDIPTSYPLNVSVVGVTATSAELVWEPPPLPRRNGKLVHYVLVYRDINGQHNGTEVATATHATVSGLRPDTTYDFRVQAFTSKGGGPPSPSIQSKTRTSIDLLSTTKFTVEFVTTTSVMLTWELPQSFMSQGHLKIFYARQQVEVTADQNRKLISHLHPDTNYSFLLMNNGSIQKTITTRTAPNLLSNEPTVNQLHPEDGRGISVSLPQIQTGISIRCFYIVVVPVAADSDRWIPENENLNQLLEYSRHDSGLDQDRVYVASQLDTLPQTFVLGDNQIYNGFQNRALLGGRSYCFYVIAELTNHLSIQIFSSSPSSQSFTIRSIDPVQVLQEDAELVWVIGPVLAVVLIIITVIFILLFKSKQERKQSRSSKDDVMVKDLLLTPSTDPVEQLRLKNQIRALQDHPPVAVCDLDSHIERLKADNGLRFSQEFQSIDPDQMFTWENSNMAVNKPKNRYANVVAYDHSRVALTPLAGVLGSDYINANFVDGYRKQNAYIATQGPLPATLSDFWRMVWEQRVVTVVMMTRLEEESRVKCEQYWPTRGSETFGMIRVTLLDCVELAAYCVRTFSLIKSGSGEKREVKQFQFLVWPDHGVPDHPATILSFLRRVQTWSPSDGGPVVVHCSAGVGRTGCFIVAAAMLDRLRQERSVDIYGHVTCIRGQRNYMVQTEEQYIFVHDILQEAAVSGDTNVPSTGLYAHVQRLNQTVAGEPATAMMLEFRKLSSGYQPYNFVSANLPSNRLKNRLGHVLPHDSTRVVLQPIRGEDGSDYINANYVHGYRQQKAYIAAQAPLAETADDFWRMLWEQNSTIVVMLSHLREMGREKCYQYWPAQRSTCYRYFLVDPVAEYNMPLYVLREFRVTDARSGQSRTIRQFQFTDWPEQGVPLSGGGVVDFIGQVHKTKEQFGQDGPITVHCSSGSGRTGVFLTLSLVLERIRFEDLVDIFQTVRTLRTQRVHMVQTQDQYQFCYRAVLDYLGTIHHYAT